MMLFPLARPTALLLLLLLCSLSTIPPLEAQYIIFEENSTLSPAPTAVPTSSVSPSAPANNNNETTTAPTASAAPSTTSDNNHNETTTAPTTSQHPTTTTGPPVDTPAPSVAPSTELPSSAAPSSSSSSTFPPEHHKTSIGRMLGRTIGWLILIGLSVLAFGGIMSNRYRIYYGLRGVWYTILQLQCTRWMIQKIRDLRRGRGSTSSSSLNEVIFDQGDLTEGLLMRDNNEGTA